MAQIDKNFIKRFAKFGVVGTSGIVVNSAVLWSLYEGLKIPVAVASIFAMGAAIFYNFNLNDIWTWSANKHRRKHNYLHRLWRYYFSASLGSGINYVILISLTHIFGMYYLLANLIGILAGTMSNFYLGDKWVFKNSSEPE